MKKTIAIILFCIILAGCRRAGESGDKIIPSPEPACRIETKTPAETAETLYQKGVKLIKEGDSQGAVNEFTKALQADRNHFKARYDRGVTLAALGRNREALEDFTGVLELEPKYFVYYSRALVYRDMDMYEESLRDLNGATALNQSIPEIHIDRAVINHILGNSEQALNDLNKACKLAPGNWRVSNTAALIHLSMGNSEQAMKSAEEAVSKAPRHPSPQDTRGMILLVEGKPDLADEAFAESIELDPEEPYSYLNLSYGLKLSGNEKKAEEYLKTAEKLNDRNKIENNLTRMTKMDPEGELGRLAREIRSYWDSRNKSN